MTEQELTKWLKRFTKGWEKQDPDQVMSLFDKTKLTYFESATKNPITSWDKVYELWKIIPINQKDIKLWSEILISDDKIGVIHWKLTRFFIPSNSIQNIDGIFTVSLNEKGLCTYFNQWRTVA